MPTKPKKTADGNKDIARKTQLGKNISTLRKKAGYTSSLTFAIEFDLNASQLARWETGKLNPEFLNLCKLADALGVPPMELLRGIE